MTKLTEREISNIKKTTYLVVNDIYDIAEQYGLYVKGNLLLETLRVDCDLSNCNPEFDSKEIIKNPFLSFVINDDDMFVYHNTENRKTLSSSFILWRKVVAADDIIKHTYIFMSFLNHYFNDIRPQIIEAFKEKGKEHKELVNSIDEITKRINNKFNNVSTVEINLPDSNNTQRLCVSNDNGQKIATINFGDQIVRIITSGDIVVVDEDGNVKDKDKVYKKENR